MLGFQQAGFEVMGGVYLDEGALGDLQTLAGVGGLRWNLDEWEVEDMRRHFPHPPTVLVMSPPCQGNSACLSKAMSLTEKYRRLNELGLRALWLALETWPTPPTFVVFENVPRIQSRSKDLLRLARQVLQHHGYAVVQTTHDCGEAGGLAQHRRRFLMVARHMKQCGEWLYEPPLKRVKGVGEVLGQLPVPDGSGGEHDTAMHRLPRMWPINWLRLALIPAGGDWKDLPESVALADSPTRHNGPLGVVGWRQAAHTVVGAASARATWASVADPRIQCSPRHGSYGVKGWTCPSDTVVGCSVHDNRPVSVCDPRLAVATHCVVRTSEGKPVLVGPSIDLESKKPCHMVILAEDGTWHRPMTTLELAVLQGLPSKVRGHWFTLQGRSHTAWRKRIGNAIPPPAARAIGESILRSLEASDEGRFLMDPHPVWVRPNEVKERARRQGGER